MTFCKTCNDEKLIHHQHPMKPPGVIITSTPCPDCSSSTESDIGLIEGLLGIRIEEDSETKIKGFINIRDLERALKSR